MAFDGPSDLGDKLWLLFGANLGLPYIEKNDLCLLDEAIAMLSPPEAQVRVFEVETFMVREKLPFENSLEVPGCAVARRGVRVESGAWD